MKHRSRLRVLAAAVAVTAALAVATPATVASAKPCQSEKGCRGGGPSKNPEWQMGWILYADADGAGSYWTYALYEQNSRGQCFDFHGVGVGCP